MDEKSIDLQLCIPNESELSEFVIDLIKEEAEAIKAEIDMLDGEVKIRTAYVHELEDKVEVSFYIINNTSKGINFENISLCLVKADRIVGTQVFQAKELENIPAKTIKYCTLYFSKGSVKTSDFENVEIKFDTREGFKSKRTINFDIANLPKNMKKNDSKIINTYLKELPYLEVDIIDINTFSAVYDAQGNLHMIIVIRNGWKSEIKLEILPVKVYDSKDTLIYSGVFKMEDTKIAASTAVVQSIFVPEGNLLIKAGDLSTYRVEFK